MEENAFLALCEVAARPDGCEELSHRYDPQCMMEFHWSWDRIFRPHTAEGPVVHRSAGGFLFLSAGRCKKMVGTASALSLVLPCLVLMNCSASKCACRVIQRTIGDSMEPATR
ncbi:uncharacterized protein LOC143477808 [Brachyhypopomus gauderio]|uniref:uncharacterized protein LOC143477808 n=1 Tax=Brachyhypopomus gauderio TaxID=698409 RepID=UPI0040434D1F